MRYANLFDVLGVARRSQEDEGRRDRRADAITERGSSDSRSLQRKYRVTSWLYDVLDYPWERKYRRWRARLVGDMAGRVLEAGVGSGRNLQYYPANAEVHGIDLSAGMLRHAHRRARRAACRVNLENADATHLPHLLVASFDWYVSTFMYCVMPDASQPLALAEMARLLRPGGHFRLLEMVYSNDPKLRRRQERFAPFVERVYGARFDRRTLDHVRATPGLRVDGAEFLERDVYLLIEGHRG